MGNYPMVDQVNKLIGNILAERGEVALPEIGTLSVERHPAERLSRSMIKPPCRKVVFTPEIRGKRLAIYIAEAARCETAAAEEIYGRWLARVYADEVLTIEGIGTLKNKQFILSAEFDRRLNPQGTGPVKVHRPIGFDWVLWCGVVAIGCGLCFGAYYLYDNRDEYFGVNPVEPITKVEKMESVATTPVEEPVTDSLATEPAVTEQPVATEPAPEKEDILLSGSGTVDAPAKRVSQRSYVVLGVFGSKDNAQRAVEIAHKNHPDWHLGVYRLGENLLVSAFESDSEEPCRLFKRAHQAEYRDMWIHKAR